MTGEFAAIQRLRDRFAGLNSGRSDPVTVGIGDDAAAIRMPSGGWLLLAIDTVVAGVHVDLALSGLSDLGWKAVAVNVSDIAAMGGRPAHALLSVAGPAETDLDSLSEGVAEAARAYECPIVGGDLANADTLVVTVAISGLAEGEPILRSGARPADEIWVTGPLGLSAAGLRLLREKGASSGRAAAIHRRPRPSVNAGLAARAAGATAMIDISDGLVADLGHVADASGVGFTLDRVPVGEEATVEEALTGGEDYVLAFTAPDSIAVRQAFTGLPSPELIGACTDDPAERTFQGRALPAAGGWEHTWSVRRR